MGRSSRSKRSKGDDSLNVAAEKVRQQITAVLSAWGMDSGFANTTADVMVDTDLAGIDSHGISMLMTYEEILGLPA